MPTSAPLPRTIARLGALLAVVVAIGAVGPPAAHAVTPTVDLILAPGQSGPIGTLVSNTDVTPVPTCDPGLSVSFDAAMAGTVHVASDATLGTHACSVDFQILGQSIGLIEQVSVDVVPGLSIDSVTVREGTLEFPSPIQVTPNTEGTPSVPLIPVGATFTVTMSTPSPSPVTVHVATADGTATEPSDYSAVDTTVTFQPGHTSVGVVVPITPDSDVETDETFSVNLSAATDAVITGGQGIGTIVNDDPTFTGTT